MSRAAVRARHLEAVQAQLQQAGELFAMMVDQAERVTEAVAACATALRRGKQVIFCGNGGSAAQASHLAGELSGRFYRNRPALRALSLNENTAALTAIANDFGYERIFERQLEAVGRSGDVVVALTTSGKSPNIRRVVRYAAEHGMTTLGLTGQRGRSFAAQCDLAFVVPSLDTARIQEVHILLGHVVCARVEAELFPDAE